MSSPACATAAEITVGSVTVRVPAMIVRMPLPYRAVRLNRPSTTPIPNSSRRQNLQSRSFGFAGLTQVR